MLNSFVNKTSDSTSNLDLSNTSVPSVLPPAVAQAVVGDELRVRDKRALGVEVGGAEGDDDVCVQHDLREDVDHEVKALRWRVDSSWSLFARG